MTRHKQIRIRLSRFMGSYRGKVLFNFFYGIGAALVVLGLMFKLLHFGGANIMLFVALSLESLIFALSAFEPPFRNYHWEEVFPVLDTSDENDRPDFSGKGGETATGSTSINGLSQTPPAQQQQQTGGVNHTEVQQAGNLADISVITDKYLTQLSGMADNLNRFSDATNSLAEVSNILLNSYRNITENSDVISNSSKGYVEQMGNLNRNLMGLNTIYEIQLKSISSQIDTIDRVNKGMVHIKDMYEGSITDSERFNKETEGLADNLAKLNMVYTRMLEAMTSNIVISGLNPGKNPETPKESGI
ncbi:MAG: gliding motility protein GldL [Bacteroidales bacterium]|nr:gliding motility protein GldL [Bacteroidales bacterium]